jgi:ankyrin repeat protein
MERISMRSLIVAMALVFCVSAAQGQAIRRERDGSEGRGGNLLAGPEIVRAAGSGDADLVRAELARGTSPNKRNVHGITGLMAAARKGHVAVIQLLIRAKARIDAKDPQRNAALHFAAQFNHYEAAALILKAGGDPNPVNRYGSTPLMQAVKNGHLETVEVLLRKGADVNAADYTGKTAADHARDLRRTAILRRLKEAGKR